MRHVKLLSLILVANLLTLLPLTSRADVSVAEFHDACKWFDGLGYPPVDRLPFVKVVWDEQYIDSTARHDAIHYRYGFLAEDHAPTFTVFYPDLTSETYSRSTTGPSPPYQAHYEVVNLVVWAKWWLTISGKNLKNYYAAEDGLGYELPVEAQAFILARACATRGEEILAVSMCNQAAGSWSRNAEYTGLTLTKALSNQMGTALMERIDFADAQIPWTGLLARFEEIDRKFPDSKADIDARDAIKTLSQMVQEDREHAAAPVRPIEALSVDERVKELIFQLPDQNARRRGSRGYCSVFRSPHDVKSPAGQLAAIGSAAVPQLIGALIDMRLTRCTGDGRATTYPNGVLRVRDVALVILDKIAGRTFEAQGGMVIDRHGAYVKAAIEQWWTSYQKRGELTMLLEGASRGNWESYLQAEILVNQYPESSLPAIAAGLKSSTDPIVAFGLVVAASRLKGTAPIDLLYDQMLNGIALSVRVEAARGLEERNDARAVPAMLAEWKRPRADKQRDLPGADVAQFLLTSGQREAVAAVGQYLLAKPVEVRLKTVIDIMGGRWRYMMKDKEFVLRSAIDPPTQAVLERAVEKVLAGELLDTAICEYYGVGGEHPPNDPRVCDAAADAMSTLWPTRYRYKDGGSRAERDAQRLKMFNVWLKTTGSPSVKLP